MRRCTCQFSSMQVYVCMSVDIVYKEVVLSIRVKDNRIKSYCWKRLLIKQNKFTVDFASHRLENFILLKGLFASMKFNELIQ